MTTISTVIREQCGTPNGYQLHIRRHEQPCPECYAVQRRYQQRRRFLRGKQRYPGLCRECGSMFPNEHTCTMLFHPEEGVVHGG